MGQYHQPHDRLGLQDIGDPTDQFCHAIWSGIYFAQQDRLAEYAG